MPNNEKDPRQDKNIQFLKWIVVVLLSLFLVINVGIYQQKITLFHFGILFIIFFIIGTFWIQIGPDGIKFGSSNTKEQKLSTTTIEKYYDNRKIYYPIDTSFSDNNDKLLNNITETYDQKSNPKN